jgi:hypothetical protein
MMPAVAARMVSRTWWSSPVRWRRSRWSANRRTWTLSRPCSAALAIRSRRRGRRRSIGSRVVSSSVTSCLAMAGSTTLPGPWPPAKARASATRSNPGASWVSVPSSTARARKVAATSGGTDSP